MQIMPSTAAGLNTDADALFDTRTNIRLGIQYLQSLLEQYGTVDKALAHYVGGTAAAAAYPFVTDEVRSYVDNVLNQTARYELDQSAAAVPKPAATASPTPGPRLAVAAVHPHNTGLSKENGTIR